MASSRRQVCREERLRRLEWLDDTTRISNGLDLTVGLAECEATRTLSWSSIWGLRPGPDWLRWAVAGTARQLGISWRSDCTTEQREQGQLACGPPPTLRSGSGVNDSLIQPPMKHRGDR